MKKFALTAMVAAVAMVGCTTNNTTPVQDSKTVVKHDKDDVKRKKHGAHPHHYQCANAVDSSKTAHVVAKYQPKSDTALLNVTAPQLGLERSDVEMKLAVSGSGNRYVNDTNPTSLYEWHSKASEGVLTVTVNGAEYQYNCVANQMPPKNHPPV